MPQPNLVLVKVDVVVVECHQLRHPFAQQERHSETLAMMEAQEQIKVLVVAAAVEEVQQPLVLLRLVQQVVQVAQDLTSRRSSVEPRHSFALVVAAAAALVGQQVQLAQVLVLVEMPMVEQHQDSVLAVAVLEQLAPIQVVQVVLVSSI